MKSLYPFCGQPRAPAAGDCIEQGHQLSAGTGLILEMAGNNEAYSGIRTESLDGSPQHGEVAGIGSLGLEPAIDKGSNVFCPGGVACRYFKSCPLEGGIVGVQQGEHLVNAELGAHAVKGNEAEPAHQGGTAFETCECLPGVSDVDERVAQGVVEVIIRAGLDGFQEGRDRSRVTDLTQGFCSSTAGSWCAIGDNQAERFDGSLVFQFSEAARCCLADPCVVVGESCSQGRQGIFATGPGKGPDCPGPGFRVFAAGEEADQGLFRSGSPVYQCLPGAVANPGALVSQQAGEVSMGSVLPVDFTAEGVSGSCSTFSADPVDGSAELGFGELGCRTAPAEPAAGIDDQQASIVVLQHIGGVKVDTGGPEKDLVLGAKG